LWELYATANPRLERALHLVKEYLGDPGEVDLTPYLTLTSLAPSDPAAAPTRLRGRIYLDYRRGDATWARRIKESLDELGWTSVEPTDLRYGAAWGDAVGDALATCDALVVVIGRAWQGDSGSSSVGDDRAGAEGLALESADSLGLAIIPVLVDDVTMTSDLPQAIFERQAVSITEDAFGRGIAVLERALGSVAAQNTARK
jgi:hypothetical protein